MRLIGLAVILALGLFLRLLFTALETAAFMRTAIVMLAALFGISTSAFAQGWIGPAYVTGVVEGDFI